MSVQTDVLAGLQADNERDIEMAKEAVLRAAAEAIRDLQKLSEAVEHDLRPFQSITGDTYIGRNGNEVDRRVAEWQHLYSEKNKLDYLAKF
jgi:hypothetical protein